MKAQEQALRINGAKLREKRMALCMTQADLAEGTCTASMISLIEQGKANPSERLADMLAAKLGVAAEELK